MSQADSVNSTVAMVAHDMDLRDAAMHDAVKANRSIRTFDDLLDLLPEMILAALPVFRQHRFKAPEIGSEDRRRFGERIVERVVPIFSDYSIADAWAAWRQLNAHAPQDDHSVEAITAFEMWLALGYFIEAAAPLTADDIEARIAYLVEFARLEEVESCLLERVAADIAAMRSGALPAPGPGRFGEWHAARAVSAAL